MMRPSLPLIVLLPALLIGCSEEVVNQSAPELLVPDEVEVEWDEQFDAAEGVGALLPVDLMVYDGTNGEPMGNMALNIEAIDDVDFLHLLEDDDVENVEAGCLDCFWDAGRDRYISFDTDEPLSLDVTTDAEGLARVYIWVDALPNNTGVSVTAPQLVPVPQHTFELRSAQ